MNYEEQINHVKKLRYKSELNRNAHALLCAKYKNSSKFLHGIILISSSIVAILTFADFDDFLIIFGNLTENIYEFSVGIFASAVFILTVLEVFLNLSAKSSSHEYAVKQLTTFIRVLDTLEKKKEITDEDLLGITNQYTMINENTPLIPDKGFYKAKQKLKRKIFISKSLDKNPFVPIWIMTLIFSIRQTSNYIHGKTKESDEEE